MDLNLSHSVQLDQGRVIRIGSQYKGKKGHFGGMHTVHGLEPLSMELLLFIQKKEIPIHSKSQSAKPPYFLVLFTSEFQIRSKQKSFILKKRI